MEKILAAAPLLALLVAAGCQRPAGTIADGATVTLHYTLTVDGEVVDSSAGTEPLVYTHGAGQLIPGLEEQLAGLSAGETLQTTVPPERGYGEPTPDAVQKVPKENFAELEDLQVGTVVTGQQGPHVIQGTVTEISDDEVTLDMNHPLAGKTLHFDVEIIDVQGGTAPDPAEAGGLPPA